MNNVYTFDPKQKAEEERKEQLLEVLEEIKSQVEAGEIKEIAACSIDKDGIAQIHISALDLPGAVGLFEIGKHILISGETEFD
jgi:hypothetical protein